MFDMFRADGGDGGDGDLALQIVTHQLLVLPVVPSTMCQDVIVSAVRRKGKLTQLETFLLELGGKAATTKLVMREEEEEGTPSGGGGGGVSQYVYNTIYLAALCDPLLDVHYDKRTQYCYWPPSIRLPTWKRLSRGWIHPKHNHYFEEDCVRCCFLCHAFATVLQAA